MKKKLTLVDFIVIALVFAIGIVSMLLFFGTSKNKGNYIRVDISGEEYATYDLSKDKVIEIKNQDHINVLEIKNGQVYMKDANCKDHLCMNQGRKNCDGQTIICLPHKMVVTVFSKKEDEYDSIAK